MCTIKLTRRQPFGLRSVYEQVYIVGQIHICCIGAGEGLKNPDIIFSYKIMVKILYAGK